ncbi:MAG: sialidase family protein [Gemmatimonadales bacterium]
MRHPHRMALAGVTLLAACHRGPSFGPVESVVTGPAENPTMALDSATGTLILGWAATAADSSTGAWVLRRAADGTLSAPVRVSQPGEKVMLATQNPVQVVTAPGGVVYAAWVVTRSADTAPEANITLRLARSADGGASFGEPVSFTPDSGRAFPANLYADLAVAPDGALLLSWLDLHAWTDSVAAHQRAHRPDSVPVVESWVGTRVARSSDGGRTFLEQALLDSSSCICCRTAVAVGADARAHVVWRHVFPGSVRDFQSASSASGSATFAPPTRVHEDKWVLDGCPDIGPDLAVDGSGAVHVAWYTGAPGRRGLWYAASRDGGASYGAPVPVLTEGAIPPSEVRVATVARGAWLAWEDRRTSPGVIRVGRPGEAGVVVGPGRFPAIVAGANLVAVAWETEGGLRLRVAPR